MVVPGSMPNMILSILLNGLCYFSRKGAKAQSLFITFVTMFSLSHKSKQYLLVALKVLILVVAIIFILQKVINIEPQTWTAFKNAFSKENPNRYYPIVVFLILTALNWALEIRKWKLVVSHLQPISFKTSLKQSLASLTASLATPARIGDYGAKAAYYSQKERKQIFLLNFFSSGIQMAVTTFFGIIGCIIVVYAYPFPIALNKLVIVIIALIIGAFALYFFRNKTLIIKGLSVKSVFSYFKKVSIKIKVGTILLSLLRYITFSSLFFFILVFFGSKSGFLPTLNFIFAMYFFVSIIPSFFVLDVVIRGGVAVWLLSILGIPEPTVLCAVLAMWLLNFALPAIIGSYFVMTFKLQKTT